jgi:hypothetical protein
MIDIERQKGIEANITDTLGIKITQQYCQNASALISMILAADGDKPANLEENLALNVFLTECIKRYYHIDPEMFEIDVQKSYRSMEMIIEEAARNNEQNTPAQELPPEVLQMMAQAQDATAPLKPFPEEIPETVDGDADIREFPAPAPEEVEDDEEDTAVADSDDAEVVGDIVASDTDAETSADDTDASVESDDTDDTDDEAPVDDSDADVESDDEEDTAVVDSDDDTDAENVEPTQAGE